MTAQGFAGWARPVVAAIDRELERVLPPGERAPERLHLAMRHSVLAGGKRVRPLAVVLSGEACGAERAVLLPGAAALELIHTFSLVHDDLPALDDDDLRRGRPTLHRQFDEAIAILAGDALLAGGLTLLATEPAQIDPAMRARAVALVGSAAGSAGMIGGQVDDLEAETAWSERPREQLDSIHRRKTGALLEAALRLGGLYAGVDEAMDHRLGRLGRAIGLIFQMVDDILDVEGDPEALGKAAGKDAAARKLTYPALYGLEETRRRLAARREEAIALAKELPHRADLVASFVEYLVARTA